MPWSPRRGTSTRRAAWILAGSRGRATTLNNVARVLRSLARNTATRGLGADDRHGRRRVPRAGSIDYHTVLAYVRALTRVFVVEDLPAWSPALRSRGVLRSSATRHFVDPSLAAAALGAGADRLLADPETLGLLFESLVVRDLRVYGQAIGATVSHYREDKGAEADAILQLRDGRWAAIEVKLGQGEIDERRQQPAPRRRHVDTDRHGNPRSWRWSPAGDTPTGGPTASSSFRSVRLRLERTHDHLPSG